MTTPQGPQDPTSPQPYDRNAQYDPSAQSEPSARYDPSARGPSLSKPGDATPDPYGAAASGGPADPGQYPQQPYQQAYQQSDASAQGYPQGDPSAQGGYQQPGAFPQQGDPGQFGQPGMAPVDPSATKAKAKQRNIYIAVIAVVAIAVVAFFVIKSKNSDTSNASVGDCIQVTDATADNAKTNQIDCGDPKAAYVVTEVGNNVQCDKGSDSSLGGEASYSESGSKKTVCMRPNWTAGECLKTVNTSNKDNFERQDCSAATDTSAKVVKVETATSDASKCPTGSKAYSLPKRNYLYCLAPAKS
ncbi:MAG: hypothetical protein M3Y77_02595 [Actinomycetota bacterium]|nr:hypothetical protein [Actinomycetota bacterium]